LTICSRKVEVYYGIIAVDDLDKGVSFPYLSPPARFNFLKKLSHHNKSNAALFFSCPKW